MGKYRKKPLIVEAEQFWPGKDPWPLGIKIWDGRYYIEIPDGDITVFPGDWIVTDIKNEIYVCRPSVFEAMYERIEA